MPVTLKKTIIAAALGCLMAMTPGYAGAQTVEKFASFLPPVYVLHQPIFEKFAADVEAGTKGSVKIDIYPSGELGQGPGEQYKRVASRVAEIAFGLPGYTSSVFPHTLLVELPGVSEGHEDATRKLWKVVDSDLRAEFKKTVPLGLFVTPPAVLMMVDTPVRTLGDLKGLKIRVASSAMATVVESWGATAVPMPANKVYTAMSTGVVDGALMGADSLLIFKLDETTKYVVDNLPEMPTSIYIAMNQGAYDELDDAEKAVINEATGLEMSLRASKVLADFGDQAMAKFRATPGAEVIELSPEVRAEFDAKSQEAVDKLVSDFDASGVDASGVIARMRQ